MREGWVEKKLAEVNKFIDYRGKTPKKTSEGLRLITAKNVKMGVLNTAPEEFIHPDDYESWMTRGIPQKGDVLFTTEAPLANVALLDTDEKVALAQRIITLCPDREVLTGEYLNYCIQSKGVQDKILEKGTGATVTGIKSRLLKEISIPIPPLDEQKQIVALLDKTFAAIDQAKANVEKNLQNAKELFQSKLNETFSQENNSWKQLILSEILTDQPRNGWSPPAKNHADKGTPVLTLSSVTGFEFKQTKIKHTSAATKEVAHYWVENGNLLITRSNTPELVGHVAIASNIKIPTIYPDLIMKMKVNPDIASTRFIYYQLRSTKLRDLIMSLAKGANPTMKKINKGAVQNLPVTFPHTDQQEKLTEEFDVFSEKHKLIIIAYQKKLVTLENLKKSILQKAFAGELT